MVSLLVAAASIASSAELEGDRVEAATSSLSPSRSAEQQQRRSQRFVARLTATQLGFGWPTFRASRRRRRGRRRARRFSKLLLCFKIVCVLIMIPTSSSAPTAASAATTTNDAVVLPTPEIPNDPWSRLGGGCVNERPRGRKTAESATATTTVNHISSVTHDDDDDETNNIDTDVDSQYDPLRHKAHLWHALEGIDRYPNYLSRWSDESDILRLERALEAQLQLVRQQRRSAQSYKQFLRSLIANDEVLGAIPSSTRSLLLEPPKSWQELRDRQILDPKIVEAILSSRQFRTSNPPPPTLEAICSGSVPGIELDVSRLASVMDEEVPDVFALPVLTKEFGGHVCDWIEAVASRVQHHLASRASASQHDDASTASPNDPDLHNWTAQSRRPLDLSDVGLDWLVNLLFNLVVQPVSRHLFAEEMGGGKERSLDWRQAFVAGYSPTPSPSSPSSAAAPRQHLVPHTDDSEVTLNVCLGRDFTGGVLEFGGLRAQPSRHGPTNPDQLYEPQPGRGVIHAGRHFHAVSPVTSGSRYALIVWARSWSGIRATTCPCCWLNRRTNADHGAAQPCICGPRWN
jgi:hypothetical protein